MSDDAPQVPDTLTGRCMCGAVTYKIAEKPLVAGLCHCDRCRPQSGTFLYSSADRSNTQLDPSQLRLGRSRNYGSGQS